MPKYRINKTTHHPKPNPTSESSSQPHARASRPNQQLNLIAKEEEAAAAAEVY
jgi:hypothetical protein